MLTPSPQSVRIAASLAALALLSACAGKPQLSAQQESSQYLSRAGRNYTPPGPASDPWGPYIKEAAAKFDVPERWIREVMRQESGGRLYGRNGDLVTSGAGAMGLMQVMPGTYAELRNRYSELGDDAFDPRNNILAGTAYIREMYDIYGSPGFLAAYNAGPGRLDDHLTRNRTLPEETRRYVASIGPRIAGVAPNTRSPGEQYAMNALPLQIPEGPRYPGARFRSPEPSRPVAIALNPSPYLQAAYTPAPVPLPVPVQAAAEPAAAPIRLSPQPVELAQLSVPSAEPADRIRLSPQPLELEPLPEPPRPEFARPEFARSEFARPEPTRPAFTPAPAPQYAALTPALPLPLPPAPLPVPPRAQAMAALVPSSPPRPGFSLVSAANAAPVRPAVAKGAAGGWAVQVGAFANPGLASSATVAAKGQAHEVLGAARPQVASVRQGSGTLYRARLTGLSHEAAAHACEKLARARTNCMLVSPDAQS